MMYVGCSTAAGAVQVVIMREHNLRQSTHRTARGGEEGLSKPGVSGGCTAGYGCTASGTQCLWPIAPWGDEGVQRRGEADVAPAAEVVVEALQVPGLNSQVQLEEGGDRADQGEGVRQGVLVKRGEVVITHFR